MVQVYSLGRQTTIHAAASAPGSSCTSINTATHTDIQQEHSLLLQCQPVCHFPEARSSQPYLQQGQQQHWQQQQQQQQLCTLLLQQLDAVGWQHIGQLAPDLSNLCLQLHDAAGRLHTAKLQLPAGFPVSAPTVTVHLPKPFKLKWLPGHTLLQLTQQLEQALDSYQALWAQLEDIDHHTQLLDPPQALAHPYANCSRCVALGNGASCQLQLSAASPHGLPTVIFHGPSSIVARLQAAWYGSAAQQWDEQQSVRENLQAVLQVQLPAPKPGSKRGCAAVAAAAAATNAGDGGQGIAAVGRDTNQAEAAAGSEAGELSDDDYDTAEEGACCVCYSLHLPDLAQPDQIGEAPSVTCPGASCNRVFHAMCLAEWLGALPTSRRVFDTLFGSCPFCNGPIGVSTRPVTH